MGPRIWPSIARRRASGRCASHSRATACRCSRSTNGASRVTGPSSVISMATAARISRCIAPPVATGSCCFRQRPTRCRTTAPSNGVCRETCRSRLTSTAIRRPISPSIVRSTGEWFIRYSASGFSVAGYGRYQWGLPGDRPLVADFDGDGKADLTVYRPSTGQWFVRLSSESYSIPSHDQYQWGLARR